uniref:Uncharacterized protein n=1 Tax=Ciona savignyi TaxID=51511 RepID=H2YCJ3_CIOSA
MSKLYQRKVINIIRLILVLVISTLYLYADDLQSYINWVWSILRSKWWYQSVYNETAAVQIYSVIAFVPFRIMNYLNIGTKYKIPNAGSYENTPVVDILMESFEYSWPLVILDTFHVKHYVGVAGEVVGRKRRNWIQVTRELPVDPPLLGDMVRHLVVALVLYDLAFFL